MQQDGQVVQVKTGQMNNSDGLVTRAGQDETDNTCSKTSRKDKTGYQ